MRVWAIVPVKTLAEGKSRLAAALSSEERAELSRTMLTHTLDVLSQVAEIEGSLVISRDNRALELARALGAKTLLEQGSSSLNRALKHATEVVGGYQASRVLVLPADLPLISETDLRDMVAPAHDPPVVAIAPDRHGRGTNAMLVAPPATIKYRFGPDSFERHIQAAEEAGAHIEVRHLPALGLDLDSPKDLEIYYSRTTMLKE